MNNAHWKTAISDVKPNDIRVRGYRIDELMGRIDFGQAVHLLLRSELPSESVGRLITAILVSCIDHGADVPSTHAARNAASSGGGLSACVASGVLAVNRFHGGAIEDCARALRQIVQASDEAQGDMDRAADRVLADFNARGERIAGYGHVLHTADPRTARLFALAGEAGIAGRYVEACQAVARGLERQSGRKLPINVDGAIAALLLELGYEEEVMNGLFIISRIPGLIAHAREETVRERRLRPIVPGAHEYDGSPPRACPESNKASK